MVKESEAKALAMGACAAAGCVMVMVGFALAVIGGDDGSRTAVSESTSSSVGSRMHSAGGVGRLLGDPAPSWLTYAEWKSPTGGRITKLSATWVVPAFPANREPMAAGAKRVVRGQEGAPSWYIAIQNAEGNGALLTPMLEWGRFGEQYQIFDAVYDWTDASEHESGRHMVVHPGDTVRATIEATALDSCDSCYTLRISSTAEEGVEIEYSYRTLEGQNSPESAAYFVMEHAPKDCASLPADRHLTFEAISLEVDGQPLNPAWTLVQKNPKCNAVTAVSRHTGAITMRWDLDDEGARPRRSVYQLLLAGIGLGVIHVLSGPDHLSALVTLSVGGSWRAFMLGVRWGCGHSSGLILMTILFFSLDVDLEAWGPYCEALVGGFMIVLGLGSGYRVLRCE